jgi:hypothetical protein
VGEGKSFDINLRFLTDHNKARPDPVATVVSQEHTGQPRREQGLADCFMSCLVARAVNTHDQHLHITPGLFFGPNRLFTVISHKIPQYPTDCSDYVKHTLLLGRK